MPNETETAALNEQREDQNAESFDRAGGSNGYDSGAAQYNALHEANLAHEDEIRRTRQELQELRERLDQAQQGAGGAPPNMEAVLLRISELERKIGEGAPDPLLNEIVHRLAALEQGGGRGGQDARVPELQASIDALKKALDAPKDDPRTDDVVLRIASLEGAVKRAGGEDLSERLESRLDEMGIELRSQQTTTADDLRTQIEALAKRLAEEEAKVDAGAFEDVADRVKSLEESAGKPASDPRVEDVLERLSKVEGGDSEARERISSLEEQAKSAVQIDPAEVDSRFAEVTEKLAELADGERPTSLSAQLRALEQRLEELSDPSEKERLESRFEAIEARAGEPVEDPRVEALERRLSEVEREARDLDGASKETTAAIARIDALEEKLNSWADLSEKLSAIEEKVGAADNTEKLDGFDRRLDEVSEKVSGSVSGEQLTAVESRLDALTSVGGELALMAERLDRMEESKSDAASLEQQLSELRDSVTSLELGGGDARIDAVAEQVAQLEERLRDSESASRLDDAGPRLAMIEEKIRALDDVSDLTRRLTVLEMAPQGDKARLDEAFQRLTTLEDAETKDPANQALAREVIDIRTELARLAAAPSGGGEAPDLQPLVDRITALEARPQAEPAADSGLAAEIAELRTRLESQEPAEAPNIQAEVQPLLDRIAALEEKPAADAGAGVDLDMAVRLEALEERQAAAGVDAAATRELFDRVEAIERSERGGETAAPDARVDDLLARIDALEKSLNEAVEQAKTPVEPTEPAKDPRVAELMARMESLESRPAAEAGGSVSEDVLGELKDRLAALESAKPAASGSLNAELSARFEDIERRLAEGVSPGSAVPDTGLIQELVEKESERWSQWARNTLSEMGDLRQQIEVLREEGVAAAPAAQSAGGELSAKSLESVGAAISAGMNKAEVKSLRSQMYFVYFTIGMLWALGFYFLFAYLGSE